MNRRSFIKLVAAAIAAPYLPDIAVPAKVIEEVGSVKALWSRNLFDYALKDVAFSHLLHSDRKVEFNNKEFGIVRFDTTIK